ncbi:hypothetical protein HDU82_001172, partial [Entophlyctis luteolus]
IAFWPRHRRTIRLSGEQLRPSWRLLHGNPGDRDTVVEFSHACVINNRLMYPARPDFKEPPQVNIAGSADSMNVWLAILPANITGPIDLVPASTPLFTLGTVWAYHLSHFFVNNFLPLLNIVNNIYGNTEWSAQQRTSIVNEIGNASWSNEALSKTAWKQHLLITSQEIIFDPMSLPFSMIWNSQTPATKIPVCYERVIMGLNSTCDCCGCVKDYENKAVYQQTRELVFRRYLPAEDLKSALSNFADNSTKYALKAGSPESPIVIVNRLTSRRFVNIDEITAYFASKNISHIVVNLENMPFQAQVRLFSKTRTMIAAHGNAIGNALWMPPNSKIIEVHSYDQRSQWFEHIYHDAEKGFRVQHFPLLCRDEECRVDGAVPDFNANIRVSIRRIAAMVAFEGTSDEFFAGESNEL